MSDNIIREFVVYASNIFGSIEEIEEDEYGMKECEDGIAHQIMAEWLGLVNEDCSCHHGAGNSKNDCECVCHQEVKK